MQHKTAKSPDEYLADVVPDRREAFAAVRPVARKPPRGDLPLDVVGELIASVPADKWIEIHERSRKRR